MNSGKIAVQPQWKRADSASASSTLAESSQCGELLAHTLLKFTRALITRGRAKSNFLSLTRACPYLFQRLFAAIRGCTADFQTSGWFSSVPSPLWWYQYETIKKPRNIK